MCLSTEYLTFIHIIVTIIVDKPEDHVQNTHENAYQLLKYDGKSKDQAQWEQPAYEGSSRVQLRKTGEREKYIPILQCINNLTSLISPLKMII